MDKLLVYLIVAIVALSVLASAGPVLVALAQAAVPLVVAVGIVAVVVRLVFFHTHH